VRSGAVGPGEVWLGAAGEARHVMARQELKTVKRKGNENGGI
jgi:hypothetical protein